METPEELLRVLASRIRTKYYRWCQVLGWPSQDCFDWFEEIAGEGLALAYSRIEEWDPEKGSFLYWAYMKTSHIARKELERAERHRRNDTAFAEQEQPENDRYILEDSFLKEDLRGAIEFLNEDQKLALAYYYLADFDVKRIAQVIGCSESNVIGCSESNVYCLLDRGRKKLRGHLEKERAGIGPQRAASSKYRNSARCKRGPHQSGQGK